LPVKIGLCYLAAMSATQVIEEIKHLSPAEQSRVLRFAFELARERQLSGEALSELAQQMADSNDSAEKLRLREEIHRGFYGE
jgi:isocitrate/isopropylmalate dehydrogenase